MTRLFPRMRACLAACLCIGSASAWADESFYGKWQDNAPRADQIGALEIAKDRISFHRNLVYRTKPAGAFGNGQVFEVLGLNRKKDPQGCGPTGKVRFIAMAPLPPVEGLKQEAIQVFFYSGEKAPDPKTVDNDKALCGFHPFGRG